MIQIDKPDDPVFSERMADLLTKWTDKDVEFYGRYGRECHAGTKAFNKVREHIYRDRECKEKLFGNHHQKCCYCETKFEDIGDLDIEHYRPKRAVQQWSNTPVIPFVYFWLTYDWTNLFLSCSQCNSVYKGILFPLENPAERATCINRDVSKELPLFIKPTENGREHIQFENETPKYSSERGRITIECIGLRRALLFEARLTHLAKLRKWLTDFDIWQRVISLSKNVRTREVLELLYQVEIEGIKALRQLRHATEPDAEFSSIATYFLETAKKKNLVFASQV